jgi:hypothetical protein
MNVFIYTSFDDCDAHDGCGVHDDQDVSSVNGGINDCDTCGIYDSLGDIMSGT